MSVFEYLRVLCRDDDLKMDFLEHSLKTNKVQCYYDPEDLTYCGKCCGECKMRYLFEIF